MGTNLLYVVTEVDEVYLFGSVVSCTKEYLVDRVTLSALELTRPIDEFNLLIGERYDRLYKYISGEEKPVEGGFEVTGELPTLKRIEIISLEGQEYESIADGISVMKMLYEKHLKIVKSIERMCKEVNLF